MGMRQLAIRVKCLEAWRQRPEPVAYAVPEITEEYVAEVWQLLMQYGLFASEEALLQALQEQASECGIPWEGEW